MNPDSPEENNGMPSSVKIPLKELIAAFRKNEIYTELFRELAKPKSPLPRLLLRHPEDLFPKLDPEDAVIPEDFSIIARADGSKQAGLRPPRAESHKRKSIVLARGCKQAGLHRPKAESCKRKRLVLARGRKQVGLRLPGA